MQGKGRTAALAREVEVPHGPLALQVAVPSRGVARALTVDAERTPFVGVSVDGDGAPRATSGVGVFGSRAAVIFVNTDPGWRLRGIGRAMTATALHAARAAGAQTACLDASETGLSIYRQLGFETVARMTRLSSPV